MKKILYILIITGCAALLSVSCSKDMLDTAPAGSLSGAEIFGDAGKAQSAVDGIYRLMYTNSWSVNWASEHPGLAGFTLVRSLMGEDHFQYSQGNGWFYFDYSFNVASDWTHTSGRQYGTWNMFYTFISQANYILDNEEAVKDNAEWQNVLGQAYAIRAYSYYCLYESFCQGNYTENKDKPGVPVYTKGTNKETEGVGRGTIEGLFTQINGDFQRAVDYLASAGMPQAHSSHIDLYTAYGLWARASLGQQNYPQAATCAENALKKDGLKRVATLSELGQFNNRSVGDVLWAFEYIASQASLFGSFISHMAIDGTYGSSAPQCFDDWLYEKGMTDADERRAWATLSAESPLVADDSDFKDAEIHWQTKFGYQNASTGVADIINLRAEEMLLTLAECKCRAEDYDGARSLLQELYDKRYSEPRDISGLANSASVSLDTHAQPQTLLDEILLQRRIELWCEGMGRTPDLRRLNLAYTRTETQPNAVSKKANDPSFILAIPQKEFDTNSALDLSKDQN